jgi:phosphohistidine phosphatase
MRRTLALLRHGLAAGQDSHAPLAPRGVAQIERLAVMLRAERWRPAFVLTSPYARAVETARTLAEGIGFTGTIERSSHLTPESEPIDALHAIDEEAGDASSILVVAHLPLVGRIVHELTGDEVQFSPGTFVELADEDGGARLLRRIAPQVLDHG